MNSTHVDVTSDKYNKMGKKLIMVMKTNSYQSTKRLANQMGIKYQSGDYTSLTKLLNTLCYENHIVSRKNEKIKSGGEQATWKALAPGEVWVSDPYRKRGDNGKSVQSKIEEIKTKPSKRKDELSSEVRLHITPEVNEKLIYKAKQLGLKKYDAARQAVEEYVKDVVIDRQLDEYLDKMLKKGYTSKAAMDAYNTLREVNQ